MTFWHGMNGPLADELQRLTDAYNASQPKVHVTLIEGQLRADDRQVPAVGRQSTRPRADARVHGADDGGHAVGRPVERASSRAATTPARSCRRCSMLWATQGVRWAMPFNISNPVSVLQQEDVRRRRARSGEATVSLSTICAPLARRSSRRARPGTGWRSTPASTAAAAGTSSSGSPRPASSTPTTRTAAQRPATKVLYNKPTGSGRCSRSCNR